MLGGSLYKWDAKKNIYPVYKNSLCCLVNETTRHFQWQGTDNFPLKILKNIPLPSAKQLRCLAVDATTRHFHWQGMDNFPLKNQKNIPLPSAKQLRCISVDATTQFNDMQRCNFVDIYQYWWFLRPVTSRH